MSKKVIIFLVWIMLFSFALTGCNLMSLLYPEPTPTVMVPTEVPVSEMTICLGYEPQSLNPYLAISQAEQTVLQAIYDGPIDVYENGTVDPVILASMPSFSDGSAAFTPVTVFLGDEVVDSFGDLVSLQAGISVFPSGCTSAACSIQWDGVSDLQVDQLTAKYTLKNGMMWSDGQPLTANDSVYAFQVASDPATPIIKKIIDQTSSYIAIDDVNIEWVGKPGLVTDAFEDYFWAPMPVHAWEKYTTDELLTVDEVNRSPLGWGAYMIDEWLPGEHIRLIKNPYYFRSNEGLPKTDIINFRFLQNASPETVSMAANSECDFVSSTALDIQDIIYLSENIGNSDFALQPLRSSQVEVLAVGIKPASYDDSYYPYGIDRPDIFGDVRVRQAVAYCIDRGAVNNKLLGGVVDVNDALLPSDDPLMNGLTLTQYGYDPALGIALLEQVGWRDQDLNPDTPLTAVSVANVPPGTAFEVELLSTDSALQTDIAREITINLAACGIKVNLTQLPSSELYLPGPDGRIFGRKFDLAIIPWQIDDRFNCDWFRSTEIPSDKNYWLGEVTGGTNYFGFTNAQYDQICSAGNQIGIDHAASSQALQTIHEILNQELPFISLFHFPTYSLRGTNICPENNDTNERFGVELIDIERLYRDEECRE